MSTAKLSQVTVGGPDAPNHSKFFLTNGSIGFSSGTVLDAIIVNGDHVGGGGANQASFTLEEGEYFNGFSATSDPGYMGGVVTAIKLTTNKGRSVSANASALPATGNPTVSAVVTDCILYGIELISGDFINQITFSYISNPSIQ